MFLAHARACDTDIAGMTNPTPPAGWYPDPTDSSRVRYWNGRAWTSQTYNPFDPAVQPAQDETPVSKPAAAAPAKPNFGSLNLPADDTVVTPRRPDVAPRTQVTEGLLRQQSGAPRPQTPVEEKGKASFGRSITILLIVGSLLLAGLGALGVWAYHQATSKTSNFLGISLDVGNLFGNNGNSGTTDTAGTDTTNVQTSNGGTFTGMDEYQIRRVVDSYWTFYPDETEYAKWSKTIGTDASYFEQWRQVIVDAAAKEYPVAAKDLRAGKTMTQVMAPWVTAYAYLMGQDPSTVEWKKANPLLLTAERDAWPTYDQFYNWVHNDSGWANHGNTENNTAACATLLQAGYVSKCSK